MKNMFSLAALAATLLQGTVASAADLPTFELMGFPISPHQSSVVGSARVQEQSPIPTLVLNSMPASPHQIAVLTPRVRATTEAKLAFGGPL